MELSFQTQELQKICHSQDLAEEVMPEKIAKAFRSLIADIRASDYLSEVMSIHDFSEQGNEWTVEFAANWQIKLRQGHINPPMNGSCIDITKVYRAHILSIKGTG
jgi:hypothetical protein